MACPGIPPDLGCLRSIWMFTCCWMACDAAAAGFASAVVVVVCYSSLVSLSNKASSPFRFNLGTVMCLRCPPLSHIGGWLAGRVDWPWLAKLVSGGPLPTGCLLPVGLLCLFSINPCKFLSSLPVLVLNIFNFRRSNLYPRAFNQIPLRSRKVGLGREHAFFLLFLALACSFSSDMLLVWSVHQRRVLQPGLYHGDFAQFWGCFVELLLAAARSLWQRQVQEEQQRTVELGSESWRDGTIVVSPICCLHDNRRRVGLCSAQAVLGCYPLARDNQFVICWCMSLPFDGCAFCPCWDFLQCHGCAIFSLSDVTLNEGAVFPLFGIGQRCMTKPPSLILRFNSGDPRSLSSVMVLQYLQLSSSQPLVRSPEIPSGEPPSGHILVCTLEALEDWRCSIFESEMSSDKRWLAGSIYDLQRLLLEWMSILCPVQLCVFSFSFELCNMDFMSLSCIS